MVLFLKRFDDNLIVSEIYNSKRLRRFITFLVGVFLLAIGFNLFLAPLNMVIGVSGISLVLNKLFGITPSISILFLNFILIIVAIICFGFKKASYTIIGSFVYPLFVYFTSFLTGYVNLRGIESMVLALFGAILCGAGTGLVFKAGYTTGGADVIKQILSKYGNMSVGRASLITELCITSLGLIFFGWRSFIYSIIALYLESYFTDKVILGIGDYKTFQIITEKDKYVKQFILNQLNHGVTIIDSSGGFTDKRKKILLCTIPTKEYFLLKEGISRIDPDAFFIITDTYEVKMKKEAV